MSLVVMFCFCFCFVVTPEWFTTVGNWSNKNKRVLTFIQYRDGMNAWKRRRQRGRKSRADNMNGTHV